MRIIVELKENKNKASKPNKVKIQNPDNHNKLAVFDLDETLIHGVINISNYKNEKNIISIITPSKKIAKIGVNIRPHWEEAIKRISKLYTIVIYTASHSSYADAVLNFLDPQNKYFYNRLYRSNCIDVKLNGKNFYIKDMNIFEGFDTKNILIVDNSVMSFAYHLDNGIPILPYYDAEKDYELLFVAYYFENLYHYDNLSTINKEYMKLDYYLNQAIKEYNDEIEEEEDEDFNDDSYNYNCNINNLDNDKCINKNLLFVNNDKEIKRSKRRQSQFVEQYEIDFNELRQKFSKDEEQF
jgi:CTD small phosphatase-like protein 2